MFMYIGLVLHKKFWFKVKGLYSLRLVVVDLGVNLGSTLDKLCSQLFNS